MYDDRREESKSILKETEGKLEKIEDFLRTIGDQRLKVQECKTQIECEKYYLFNYRGAFEDTRGRKRGIEGVPTLG